MTPDTALGKIKVFVRQLHRKFAGGSGAVMKAFTLPSGNSTPYEEQFSYQEAMAARGDVDGALESFESIIAEQHLVINGASQLLVDVLGEAGWHARSAVGMAALPLGASVEVEAIVKVKPKT